MSAERLERLRRVLQAELAPSELVIIDDSAAHAGHAGAQSGGHFRVRIASAKFAGLSSIERHRLVYAAARDLFAADVHALSIEAFLP